MSFKGFGNFTSTQNETLTAEKKLADYQNKFKGKGIVGKLSGNFILKSGKIGELIVLPEMMVYRMDHKKKEYREDPIEKMNSEEEEGENVHTGQKGTDRLVTDVWTTPLTGDLQRARDEELTFTRSYMKCIGIDADSLQQMILGTHWLALLGKMSEEGQRTQHKGSNFTDEMAKIQGYPVIIDGKYFVKREGGNTEEDEDEDSGGGVKSMLAGLAKKALKKKGSKSENEPAFIYHTELIEFSPIDVGDETFQVPSNYKKKG